MKPRVPRTRNHGTMTEAAFFGMLREALRRRSMFWKPVAAAKKLYRRKNTGPNKRQKFEYYCHGCKNWFAEKDIEVDHIISPGSLKSFADLSTFAERLFCEVDGLQTLCKDCNRDKLHKMRGIGKYNTKK